MSNHNGYLIFTLELGISERVTRVPQFLIKENKVLLLKKRWLLVLLVVKCTNLLLEATIFHGYSVVTRWLLVGY